MCTAQVGTPFTTDEILTQRHKASQLPETPQNSGGSQLMWIEVAEFNRLNKLAALYRSLGGRPAPYDDKVKLLGTDRSRGITQGEKK